MAILDGIFGFPRKDAGEVGRAVAGRLLRFATNAGRVVSSLVSVDASGNLSTPGRTDAGVTTDGAARTSTSGTGSNQYAQFGHSGAADPALWHKANGLVTLKAVLALLASVDARIPFYITEDGARANGPLGSNTGPAANVAFQVSGGFFFVPRLTESERDSLTTSSALDSDWAGVLCFNTDAGRLELWNGSAWVGVTTET